MYVAGATPAIEHMDTMWPPFSSMSGRNSNMVQNCGGEFQMRFQRKMENSDCKRSSVPASKC